MFYLLSDWMRWSVVVGLLGLAAGAAPLAARPPNPVNLTVIGLRPTNLSVCTVTPNRIDNHCPRTVKRSDTKCGRGVQASLVNKDTGDAAGDLVRRPNLRL